MEIVWDPAKAAVTSVTSTLERFNVTYRYEGCLVDSSGRRHSLHVRRLPFLPDDWTPEQALAVVEWLDDLRERIWAQYEIGLYEVLREQRTAFPTTDPANPDSTDPPF